MTERFRPLNDVAAFEKALGAQVRASTFKESPVGPITLLQLCAPAAASRTRVLALIYDLSDSCASTARLLARLPDLLRGWPRETAVWAYALSDEKPLQGIPPGNLGHLLDGSIDLSGPFQDQRLTDRFRLRGSFAQPTLAAMCKRAAEENVASVRALVIGDGQLSDFSVVDLPREFDVLGMVETEEAVRAAMPSWNRAAGAAPLVAFDNPLLGEWFSARRERSTFRRWLRVTTDAQQAIHRLDAQNVARPVAREWFEWDHRQGSLHLLVPTMAVKGTLIEARGEDGIFSIEVSTLALAPPLIDADLSKIQATLVSHSSPVLEALFDSESNPAGADQIWQAAITAFARAETCMPWDDPELLSALLPQAPKVSAILCLASRPPTDARAPNDRLVLLGLNSTHSAITWSSGDSLPFGLPLDSWSIRYDVYEDRWALTVRRKDGPDSAAQNLHPTGSQRLPSLRTLDGREWAVAFSGPFRRP